MTGKRASILVVDDDDDVRNMICIVLGMEGYVAKGAADGFEALRYLREHEAPALIIVDMVMPRMDGGELIRAMSEDPMLAQIRAVVISGQATPGIAASPQVVAQLIKPVELDQLLEIVHASVRA